MSDHRGRVPHDLPEYEPSSLPLAADLRRQVRSRVNVYKLAGFWTWSHDCANGNRVARICLPSQSYALKQGLEHLKECR